MKKKKVQKGKVAMLKVKADKADGQVKKDRASYFSFGKSRNTKGRSK